MEPSQKRREIRDFQSAVMGADVPESIRGDRCAHCRGPAEEFRDALSRREFSISGLCQACQDKVFFSEER